MSLIDEPITRQEMYLSYLNGNTDIQLPEPITRIDYYLYALCMNEGGGAGGLGGDGEMNKINSIKVNGDTLPIALDKSVNIEVPTKTSELENNNDFVTRESMEKYAQPKGDYLTEIPDEYVTDEELESKGYLTDKDKLIPDGETITRDEDGTIHAAAGGTANIKPNTKEDDGYVTKGQDHPNQVWGTDDEGNPDWRDAPQGKDGKSAYDIAVDEGFQGDKEQWLESLKGEDGRSISSIRTDENNNVWVTFDDDSEEINIGKLNVNVQADFLTEGGFGKLRYYQNHFQYYDVNTGQWVDTVVTPDNIYVVNMTPLPMQSIVGRYITGKGHYALKWKESPDTVIDGQVMCVVDSVVIRRKKDSAPTDIEDGDLIIEIPRKLFGMYKSRWFVDESFSPNIGDTYYYKAFPVSATTEIYSNSSMNEVEIVAKDYELYGFEIDQNESAPEYMIRYIEDNIGWNPAHMDYDKDKFDYGDWTQENAFFMNVRPCMLNYDGTVAYYLNPNNYAYKEDGTASDISNENFGGNAMVQFPKIYWKITDLGDDRAEVRITNKNFDGSYHCWSHIDENGDEIPYCYMPIYNGYDKLINNPNDVHAVRSLSGKTPMGSKTVTQEVKYATYNNTLGGVQNIWYTEVFSDRQLVNLLLMLIGKSTDTQTVFGNGNCENVLPLNTGTMDDKGMFYGKNTKTDGVKVFGMEHWFGNIWHRIAGIIYDKGVQKLKLTYGQSDGSNSNGYNLTGQGYIEVPNSNIIGGDYLSSVIFTKMGLIPKKTNGSASTYYTDAVWVDDKQIYYALVGGYWGNNFYAGAFMLNILRSHSNAAEDVNASLSCKPLLETQQSDPKVNQEVT